MVERISLADNSLLSSYADHILRYEFALSFCRGKRVLDAGCGTGYGPHFLAANGASSVLAVDISEEALNEAAHNYRLNNLGYKQMDVEKLGDDPSLKEQFEVVVNFENIEHLQHPERLVRGAAAVLGKSGTFITSTPNGAISNLDENGKPINEFHVKEFTADELIGLLSPHFRDVSLHGQWLTHGGKLRKLQAQDLFDQLCEAYYNPANQLGRMLKRALGKKVAPPPRFGGNDTLAGDYVIMPLDTSAFPWAADMLIAVCNLRAN